MTKIRRSIPGKWSLCGGGRLERFYCNFKWVILWKLGITLWRWNVQGETFQIIAENIAKLMFLCWFTRCVNVWIATTKNNLFDFDLIQSEQHSNLFFISWQTVEENALGQYVVSVCKCFHYSFSSKSHMHPFGTFCLDRLNVCGILLAYITPRVTHNYL